MFGREREPIDWGPFSFLWPSCFFGLKLFMCFVGELFPLEFVIVLCCIELFVNVSRWAHNWWMHWWLAGVIAKWHAAQTRRAMQVAGFKFRRKPKPPPLGKLPC